MYKVTKYFELPVKTVKKAFFDCCPNSKEPLDRKDALIGLLSKHLSGGDAYFGMTMVFKEYRQGTAVLIIVDNDNPRVSFEGDISRLISNVEKIISKYASFCNLPLEYFDVKENYVADTTDISKEKPIEIQKPQPTPVSAEKTAARKQSVTLGRSVVNSGRASAALNNLRVLAIVFYVIIGIGLIGTSIAMLVSFFISLKTPGIAVIYFFATIGSILLTILAFACVKDLSEHRKVWWRAILSFILLAFLPGMLYIIWEP